MSGKAVARVSKSIDWDHLSKVVVSDAGKRDLAALLLAYDDVAATLNEKFSVKPSSINWEFYKHKLGPSVVNIFQQSYGALDKEVPDYQDDLTPVYETKHWELLNKALAEEEDSKRKIVMLEKEIDNVREQKATLSTMTVDDYFAKHPEVKDEIDDEIRNHNWVTRYRDEDLHVKALRKDASNASCYCSLESRIGGCALRVHYFSSFVVLPSFASFANIPENLDLVFMVG